jgi:DNA (cytosine-5)-methyltransferase 1
MRPRLLDLFCGAGGCSVGYHRAGFDVLGVDLQQQPHYPFPFVRADALEVLAGRVLDLDGFDAIHASPPCQGYTTMSNRYRGNGGTADSHPQLIAPVRAGLAAAGKPWVIENVPGARGHMAYPLLLHGGMFGLGVDRPRLFETSWPAMTMLSAPARGVIGVYGREPDGRRLWTRRDGSQLRAAASVEEASAAMGITWMTWDELREAIPPAYTEYLGEQLIAHLEGAAA